MVERVWEPLEWQAHCRVLLAAHYGVRVQLIPDRDRGDGGLEAYVPDEETAFQCYAPVNPKTVTAQTQAQKDKIYADTKKLVDNPTLTCNLIGTGRRIKTWVLLTPTYDSKDLITYANGRAKKLREVPAAQVWCSNDFKILIHDDSLFASARDQYYGTATITLPPATAASTIADVVALAQQTPAIEAVLRAKFSADPRLASSRSLMSDVVSANLRDYFRGESEIANLQRNFPIVSEALARAASMMFDQIASSIAESDERPMIVVRGIRQSLLEAIQGEAPGLSAELRQILANYFIASWWIQCPLRFEGANV